MRYWQVPGSNIRPPSMRRYSVGPSLVYNWPTFHVEWPNYETEPNGPEVNDLWQTESDRNGGSSLWAWIQLSGFDGLRPPPPTPLSFPNSTPGTTRPCIVALSLPNSDLQPLPVYLTFSHPQFHLWMSWEATCPLPHVRKASWYRERLYFFRQMVSFGCLHSRYTELTGEECTFFIKGSTSAKPWKGLCHYRRVPMVEEPGRLVYCKRNR